MAGIKTRASVDIRVDFSCMSCSSLASVIAADATETLAVVSLRIEVVASELSRVLLGMLTRAEKELDLKGLRCMKLDSMVMIVDSWCGLSVTPLEMV